MEYDETTTTTADQRHAWSALRAVTTYPQWTASMTTVAPLDGDALQRMLTERKTRHFPRLEAAGLKAAAEAETSV